MSWLFYDLENEQAFPLLNTDHMDKGYREELLLALVLQFFSRLFFFPHLLRGKWEEAPSQEIVPVVKTETCHLGFLKKWLRKQVL